MTSELSSIKATSKNEARAIAEVDAKDDKREEDDVSRRHLLCDEIGFASADERYAGCMRDRGAVSAFVASIWSSVVLVGVQRSTSV